MKEQTYGWYPSAKNVYEERRVETLTPYQLEALYRYRQSKYYQPPVTPPEQRGTKPSRSTRTPSNKSGTKTPDETTQYNLQARIRSAPIHTTYKPPPRLNLPTPQQCWSTHVPETEITVPPTQPSPPLSVSPMLPKEPHHMSPTSPEVQVVQSTTTAAQKKVRVQSATVRRTASSKPDRPIKSAGPVRPSTSPVRYTPQEQVGGSYQSEPNFCSWPIPSAININDIPAVDGIQILNDRPPSGRISASRLQPTPTSSSKRVTLPQGSGSTGLPPSGRRTPLRPKAPSPNKMEIYLQEEDTDENTDDRCETPDYFEQTKHQGWMMEVHGDPLKLKKVSRRLPYYVTCDEPETERDPPKVHMENNETFFLNTIPRRPLAFTIDKEWISEIIHKKRMEMQKKHGINYKYKNFSFVY
ncbi:hypothetical protein ACF0H5_016878 [Mactra antiquata]